LKPQLTFDASSRRRAGVRILDYCRGATTDESARIRRRGSSSFIVSICSTFVQRLFDAVIRLIRLNPLVVAVVHFSKIL